ncbi:MAG: hypothetical protein WC932_05560 [archaeon]|jgi:predicted GNAT superfamily acetyltransferase
MGLYDQKLDSLKLRKDKEYILIGLIVFIIIIVIGLLATTINWENFGNSFKGSNLSIKFSKNPYLIDKDTNLKMLVTVKNNSAFDSENAIITIVPVEDTFYVTCNASSIGNNKVVIPIMSKNSSRTIDCDVKISPTVTAADVLNGTYGFDVVYTLNNTEYEKRTILTIKRQAK